MSGFDIHDPFAYRYAVGDADDTRRLHIARQSVEAAVASLADTGQVVVWSLEEQGVDYGESGIYATMAGAIAGARNIVADDLVGQQGQNRGNIAYARYLVDDVKIDFVYPPEVARNTGSYHFTTEAPDGGVRTWSLTWSELLP